MLPSLVFSQTAWVPHTLFPGDEQYSVACGNNRFVSVGLGGVNFISTDGEVWTPESSGTLADLHSIIFTGNQFIAVGAGGTILTSPDGDVWKAESSGTASDLNCVKQVNNQYFALGSHGTMLVSTDGKAWANKANNAFSSLSELYSITFANNLYVVVCGFIKTSPDLMTWTDCSPDGRFGNGFKSVIYAANRFVAVGDTIAVSGDGKTWGKRNSNILANLYGLTYGNGQFVAVGAGNTILSSPDGSTWVHRFENGGIASLQSIIFEQNRFVAVGWNIITSKADTTGIKSGEMIRIPSRGTIRFGSQLHQTPMTQIPQNGIPFEFFDATEKKYIRLWLRRKTECLQSLAEGTLREFTL